MYSKPFKTFEEAKEAENDFKGWDIVHVRPNPNREEGGYVVFYEMASWWDKHYSSYCGCPRGRC